MTNLLRWPQEREPAQHNIAVTARDENPAELMVARTTRCDALRALLQVHGWELVEGGTALATKIYATAVGPKEGQAYLSRSAEDDPNETLYGQYYSEGRNVMPGVLIPKSADAATLKRLVAQFAGEADAAVAGSYAARLNR